jgi:integrase
MGKTITEVNRLKKPGRYAVGDGVSLQISQWHTRSWIFRYARHGRVHYMGLGPCSLVTLAEARAKGREFRRQLLDGIDPLADKRRKRADEILALARNRTFEQCAHEYIASHEAGWSASSSTQWRQSLEQYVFPIIGKLPVAEIDLPLVLQVLKPIWQQIPETARRVRARLENILGWAQVHGLRAGDNPARWDSHLEHILPSRRSFDPIEGFAALPYPQVPAFMARLRAEEGVAARAFEFLILTGTRRGEILGARWNEIQGGMWVIPAARMKLRREHRIPLSKQAQALLRALPRDGQHVFIGSSGRPLNHMSFQRIITKLAVGATVHGFRSAFRDWAAEETHFSREVCEQALAHKIPNAVEAAYRRGDLFEKRRRLMQDWADYCERGHVEGDVVPLRQGASA